MLSKIPERRMRSIRGALLMAWLVLIVSLVWDPVTPALTRPDNLASPFHITTPGVAIQGGRLVIENQPYPMGRRIFWTMIVPILPLFLMLAGHEAWRRVCPLSFASQIPRMLRIGRTRASVRRSTGKVERKPAMIASDSWLATHSWYVQFGLLFAGLSARLLFANASGAGLACLLLAIIGAAVLTGYLFGGKSWCQYVCPINVVQKIYTEPGGLLESQAHVVRIPISQSMCRQPTPKGDKSECVGCAASCSDIDLERSYWDTILLPARRHVYYLFFGLIVGFYGYYYLYSGTWDYYFSGVWTHESAPAARLLDTGLYVFGRPLPVVKLVAAPLTLLLACAASLGLGIGLESAYGRFRNMRGKTTQGEIRHHALTVCAFISINTFYFFGGRPNIMLMPVAAVRVIDLAIVAMTTLWMLKALNRSPMKYRREGMAAHFLEQLKKLKVDVGQYLEGRSLDELKPDEVYVLTKVLPAFSHEQKLQAYSRVLDDAITHGTTASPATLHLLGEMRTQMDISDQEHLQLLDHAASDDGRRAPGSGSGAGSGSTTFFEQAASLAKYQEMIGHALANHIESGKTLAGALADPDIGAIVPVLRASFQVTEEESQNALQALVETDGALFARLQRQLDTLKTLLGCRFFLTGRRAASPAQAAPARMLIERIDFRKRAVALRMLSLLRAVQGHDLALAFASCMAGLDGPAVVELLALPADSDTGVSWEDALGEPVVAALHGHGPSSEVPLPPGLTLHSFHDVIAAGLDAAGSLRHLFQDDDQVVQAVVISMAARVSMDLARELAATPQATPDRSEHPLLAEVKQMLAGPTRDAAAGGTDKAGRWLEVTVVAADGRATRQTFADKPLAIGSGLANDLVIASELVAPYHLRLAWKDDGRLEIVPLLSVASLVVDGQACTDRMIAATSPVRIEFGGPAGRSPRLQVDWSIAGHDHRVGRIDGVTKLMWLRECPALNVLSWSKQARLALRADVQRYARDEALQVGADEACLLIDGGLAAGHLVPRGGLLITHGGTGADSDDDGGPAATYRVGDDFALILRITEPEHVFLARRCAQATRWHRPADADGAVDPVFRPAPRRSETRNSA